MHLWFRTQIPPLSRYLGDMPRVISEHTSPSFAVFQGVVLLDASMLSEHLGTPVTRPFLQLPLQLFLAGQVELVLARVDIGIMREGNLD